MKIQRQNLIVIAGPNGAGKSTTAPSLLKGTLKVTEFVNADLIAQGLSGFQPEGAVFHAGRVMLDRIHYLAKKTLILPLKQHWPAVLLRLGLLNFVRQAMTFIWFFSGCQMRILLLHVSLSESVWAGGNVPEETIRRRYHSGIRNFQTLSSFGGYMVFYDNSGEGNPRLLSYGEKKKSACKQSLSLA